jgi:hypothetical protein
VFELSYLVQKAKYYIETNHSIALTPESIQAIEYVEKKTRDLIYEATDYEKVKYFNELRLWAVRNGDDEMLHLIEVLKQGGSIR